MLDALGGRGALPRRIQGPWRALGLAVLTALTLGACSSPDELDPSGVSFDVAYESRSGGQVRTGSLDGATVDGTFTVVVKTNRHARVARFYLDDVRMQGMPFEVDTSEPFTATLATGDLEPGRHSVTIAVYTSRGSRPNVKTVWFNVAEPSGEPADPEEPSDPTDPGQPGEPTDPDPGEPGEPTDPDPGEPDEPSPPPSQPEPPKTDYPAPTYWVSTTGSDKNDGRTADTAFRTIAKAASVVRPGDVVYIRGGVYREYLTADKWKTSGQPGKPITIMGAPGENVIIDGSDRKNSGTNPSAPQLIWLRVDWYVFENLTLRYSAGRAIELEGSNHVVRDVVTHSNHGDGIYIEGDNNLVEDVVTYDNYSTSNGGDSADGVKIAYGDGNVIRRVVAYDNSDDGIDLWDSTNSLVEYTVSYRNGRGTTGNGQGFKLSNGARKDARHTIRYNVAFGNRSNNFTYNGGGGLLVYNNTSFDAGAKGFVIEGRSGYADSKVYNNISFGESSSVRSVTQDRNSWNLGISNPAFASTEPGSSQFLRLTSGSKAIDAGRDMGQQYVGKAPDLGAYEYGLPSIVAGAF